VGINRGAPRGVAGTKLPVTLCNGEATLLDCDGDMDKYESCTLHLGSAAA